MFLKWTKDKMMITIVVRIPMTVAIPITTRLATSADWLNSFQELQLGLQRPAGMLVESTKKSLGQVVLVLLVLSLAVLDVTCMTIVLIIRITLHLIYIVLHV